MNDEEPLTLREWEVLTLVAQGYTNPEIAEILFIAPATVQSHLRSIFGKLGVKSRIQAVYKVYTFILRDQSLSWRKAQMEKTPEHAVISLPR